MQAQPLELREAQVLVAIQNYVRDNKTPPRYQDLADACGCTVADANAVVEALREGGYLQVARMAPATIHSLIPIMEITDGELVETGAMVLRGVVS